MNLPANLENISFQTVKMMKTLILALLVIRSIAEKKILIVFVNIAGQWKQRLRVFVVEIQTKLLMVTSKVINV